MVDSYRAGPRAPPSWVPVYYFQQPTEGKLRQERSQVTPQHSVFLSPWISPAPHPPQRGHLGATREREPTKRGSAGEEWTTQISPSRGISSTPFSPETRAFPPQNQQPRAAQCQAGRRPRPAAALPARKPFVSVCTCTVAHSPRGGAGGVLKVWSRFTNTPRFVTQQPSLQFAGVPVHCGRFPGRCDQVPQTGDQNRGVAGQGRAASREGPSCLFRLPAHSSLPRGPCSAFPAFPSSPGILLRVR